MCLASFAGRSVAWKLVSAGACREADAEAVESKHPSVFGSRAAVSARIRTFLVQVSQIMAMLRVSFLVALSCVKTMAAGTCQDAVEAAYANCPREIGCPSSCERPACAAIVACPPGSTYTLNGTTYSAERVQSLAEAFFSRCSCSPVASAQAPVYP